MTKRSGKRRTKSAPAATSSKRRQLNEFLEKILDALKRENGFQEAEELIAELEIHTGAYLPAFVRRIEEAGREERLALLNLISHLENPEAVPHLEYLIFEAAVDVAAKQRSAEILEQMGRPLEVGMAESLKNAAQIIEGVPALKPESIHGSNPLFVKFVRLPPTLRKAALTELASVAPGTALEFIELLRSRENLPPPETVEALVILEDPRAVKILREYLNGTTDKETGRVLRRALYRLKARGLPVEEGDAGTKPAGQGIFRPVVTPSQGFMSVVDGSGSRVVWLAKPLQGGGRLLFQAVVSDDEGLMDFNAYELNLSSFRSYIREITGRALEFPVTEIPPGYASFLIDEAYRLRQSRNEEIPQEYPIHQRQISDGAEENRPSLKEALDEARMDPGGEVSAEEMKTLLGQPTFSNWVLSEEEASPYVEEVKALLDSQLIVSHEARREQLTAACRKATAALFPAERVERCAKRLEDTAYVLLKSEHRDLARSVAGVAKSLRELDGDPAEHPFLYGMVFRSVLALLSKEIPLEEAEEDLQSRDSDRTRREEPSLILTPSELRQMAAKRPTENPAGAGGGPALIIPG